MVFDRWDKLLCEAAIVENESERFMYCPFKDCSALMIVDDDSPTESECPSCNRQICVTCEAVWHHGITCKEFGRTDNEYRVVMEVAARNQWMRCPNCRFFVEKKRFTCDKIRYRCGYLFCYGCGNSWDSTYECYLTTLDTTLKKNTTHPLNTVLDSFNLHSVLAVLSVLLLRSTRLFFIALYAPSFITLYAPSEDHFYCDIRVF
nr:E3 ubiquitin-protein ligase RNF144B-like [Arachis hypogaea]